MLTPDCSALVCLGEIDAGFLVFLLSQKDGKSPRSHTIEALTRYQEFLTREILERGVRPQRYAELVTDLLKGRGFR